MVVDRTPLDPRFNAYRADLADAALKPFVLARKYVMPTLRRCVRGVLPLYEKPARASLQISEILYGEFLDVFEERKDGFAWVQSRNDRLVGYIDMAEAKLSEGIAALMNRINVLRTFIFEAPNPHAAVLDTLTLGAFVSLDGEEGGFYPLTSGGYIFKHHVVPADEVTQSDYLFTCGQLLHTPYRQGGRTPLGIDAPGLIQLALDIAGLDAPRCFEQQKDMFGKKLPCHWRDVVWHRGDLVFFKNPDHVAVMAGGYDMISACPDHMEVMIEPMAARIARGSTLIAAGKPV
ncbi:MAG: C40 family peptidase [Alphaproteobacteria bacterium]|nr:C40 family peptidase [Alphaproteobacteria bacterium]